MKRFLRIARWLLLSAAFLATFAALFVIEENWRGRRALAAARSELDAHGHAFDLKSLVPPAIPDEVNFAATPLFRAVGYARSFDPMSCDDPAVWRRLISTPFKSNFFWNSRDWQWAGRVDLQKSLNFARINSAGMTDSRAAETVLADLLPIRTDLNKLVAAARSRPKSRLELDYAHLLDGRSWPRYGTMNLLGGAFTLRASAELRLGDNTAAFGDALALIRLALVSGSSSPALAGQSLKNILLNCELQIFWEGWATNAWTDANYTEFQSWFSQADSVPVLPLTIRMEQEKYLFEGSRPFSILAFTRKGPRGWILQDFAHVIRLTELVQEGGVDAPVRRFNPEKLKQFSTAIEATRISFPSWEQMFAYTAYTQTNIDLARVVCALERHRFSHGEYPAKLAELVPDFIDQLPRDLISGELLHYGKSDGDAAKARFKLYAIGWNSRDDGGAPSQRRGVSYSVDMKSGDWVWPQPAQGTVPQKSAAPVKTSGASP